RAGARAAAARHHLLVVGGRADAGGNPVAGADGAHHGGARAPAARGDPVHLGAAQPDDGRGGRVVRDARRRHLCGTPGLDRLRRPARHRADHPAEAAGGLPAVRVPARARHHRRHRAPEGPEGAPGPDAGLVRGVTYEEVLVRLGAAARFGMDLGLERVAATLAQLGHPERRLGRVVHVGGTNGKGSTAAMVAAMLRAAGLRTGLYTSPHLARVTERIRLDGAEVGRDSFAGRYERAVDESMTFFEQLTVVALVTFAEEGVDATVLEVGLGGRLDATNVVDADVAVVTGVALDHEEGLGDSLEAIAREKAGIFKPGGG